MRGMFLSVDSAINCALLELLGIKTQMHFSAVDFLFVIVLVSKTYSSPPDSFSSLLNQWVSVMREDLLTSQNVTSYPGFGLRAL